MRLRFLFFGLVLILCISAVYADEQAQTGRQIISKWQDAVVTLQIVTKTKMTYGGEAAPDRESKSESTAIMINPSGLAVTALSAVSPDDLIQRMMPDNEGMDISTEITSLKFILTGGKEIPAKIVLRDKDLDLAFIRPKQKPATPLTAFDLSASSKPAVLDQIITLYRLGTVASRSITACFDRVQAIVEKPRTFYVPGDITANSSPGAVIVGMDSNIVGILVLRSLSGAAGDRSSFRESVLPIVMPASDIAEVAKQAPEEEAAK